MADASHHDSPEALHYDLPENRIRHRTATVIATIVIIALAIATGVLAAKLNKQTAALADSQTQFEKANADAGGVRADLTKANAKAAELQTQLTDAGKLQVDLQAQVKKNQELGANLQTQLDQARADLQAQQDKARSQTSDLQSRLNQANTETTGLRQQLTAAKRDADDLRGQLAKAKEDLTQTQPKPMVVAAAKSLPVTTNFSKSFWLGGYTLELRNQGNDPMKLDIKITGSDKTPSRTETLQGGDSIKIREIAAGAQVVISSEGFEPVTVTAQ